ncbi:MAG: thioredoxin domain-containing protein [Erythrobacter sp.]|uniref:thioredoxin family protein n=1 Tax=Erythrobacter sp. TaxID=1042 RepID=UPI0032654E94
MASNALNTDQQNAISEFRRVVVAPSMEKLVILDFFAEWCGPCKQLTPVLKKVAAEYAERGVDLVMVDVDKQQFIAQQYQVRSMPTVYAIVNGKPIANMTNARTPSQVTALLEQLLEQNAIAPSAGGVTVLD